MQGLASDGPGTESCPLPILLGPAKIRIVFTLSNGAKNDFSVFKWLKKNQKGNPIP